MLVTPNTWVLVAFVLYFYFQKNMALYLKYRNSSLCTYINTRVLNKHAVLPTFYSDHRKRKLLWAPLEEVAEKVGIWYLIILILQGSGLWCLLIATEIPCVVTPVCSRVDFFRASIWTRPCFSRPPICIQILLQMSMGPSTLWEKVSFSCLNMYYDY